MLQLFLGIKMRSKGKKKYIHWVRLVHSYSAMAVLLSMFFFTVTGLMLNHRDWLPNKDAETITTLALPTEYFNSDAAIRSPITEAKKLRAWLEHKADFSGNQVSYEWDSDDQILMIDVKRPGGYSVAEIDLSERNILIEDHDYGALSTLNDLHMGRYSGAFWSFFIDISALAMLLFSLTGLWLVLPKTKRRKKLIAASIGGAVIMFIFFSLTY